MIGAAVAVLLLLVVVLVLLRRTRRDRVGRREVDGAAVRGTPESVDNPARRVDPRGPTLPR